MTAPAPAALALARWQEHLKGQVQPKALHLKALVQLKALELSQQEEQPGAEALQAQGLFAPGSS